jgi:hypothetical protein
MVLAGGLLRRSGKTVRRSMGLAGGLLQQSGKTVPRSMNLAGALWRQSGETVRRVSSSLTFAHLSTSTPLAREPS